MKGNIHKGLRKRRLKEIHSHDLLRFPDNFLWGSSTSAHQVEGNNTNSDWWDWEQRYKDEDFRSGLACDQFNRFEEDFDLAKKFGHNAHRLSIEWARIEPRIGEFDPTAIEHYVKVLKALKERGIKVMLTLHHFTNPLWIAKMGGWENPQTAEYFERFVKRILPEIKPYVDFFVTINEPSVYVYLKYINPVWPDSRKSTIAQLKTMLNFAKAHKSVYNLIHDHAPGKPVGIANNVQSFHAYHKHSIVEQFAVTLGDIFSNHGFFYLTRGYHDFFGINYYFHHRVKSSEAIIPEVIEANEYRDISDLGWEIYPEGIFDVLTDIGEKKIPIYITECGIASTNDDRRIRFLLQYLQEVYRAIKAGVNVKGFFYWSLIDNFEWHQGFGPRFGLVEMDYKTQARTPRSSAFVYAEIIKYNGIPHHLLRFLGHTVKAKEVLHGR